MRLNTRAFAIAGGTLSSATVFCVTLLYMVGPGPGTTLEGLSGILFGYSVTVGGAFVGAMWAYAYGFVAAAVLAFVYNVARVPPPPLAGTASPRSGADA